MAITTGQLPTKFPSQAVSDEVKQSFEYGLSVGRAIEQELDSESEDFSLEVTSAGVGSTLQNQRQYYKNIGRKLEVEMSEGTQFSGILSAVSKNGFSLQWKQREPKKIGKGKVTVKKQKTLSYDAIVSAKVVI